MKKRKIKLIPQNFKHLMYFSAIILIALGAFFILIVQFNYDSFKEKKINKILLNNKYKLSTTSGVIKFYLDPLIAKQEVEFIENNISGGLYKKVAIGVLNNYALQINPNSKINCIKFNAKSKNISLTRVLKTGDVVFAKDDNFNNCGELIFYSGLPVELNEPIIIVGHVGERYIEALKSLAQTSIKRNEVLLIEKTK